MTWCDVCAETGASTVAIGQTMSQEGKIIMTWCEQHAGTKPLRPDRKRQLASMMVLERARLGISLSSLARKIEVPKQQLSLWEQGIGLNMTSFLRWCDALGVKASVMLERAGL
jgi:DNA-binding transcriptional regulator YiaG